MAAVNAVSDIFSLGSVVWCRTCYDKEIEGKFLAFDPQTKILILSILFLHGCKPEQNIVCECASLSGDPKLNDVHFVNLSLVSELQVKREVTNVPDVPQSLNLQRLNIRVRNQVDEKRRMLQAISANVSSEGQSLFIAIAKLIGHEVRWRNSEIIVYNEVEKHLNDLAVNNSQTQPVGQNNSSSQ
ncbi:hypothetical protein NQ317_017821 [Molorchus minor]|uniref:AD domain-containing protein n=1 Tax=Molorchus minor TaxID=1323400 RepID=A0ABQ9K0N1_9CUCU|nr:hypothetical protein NQ317_017821 [Molorchus minor]